MSIKHLLELAGVDITQGTAKELVEAEENKVEMPAKATVYTLTSIHRGEGGEFFFEKTTKLGEIKRALKEEEGTIVSGSGVQKAITSVQNYSVDLYGSAFGDSEEDVAAYKKKVTDETAKFVAATKGKKGFYVHWSMEYDDNISFIEPR